MRAYQPGTFRHGGGHITTLHHKSRTLHKELKEAELALGEEPSEANLAWLQDVQQRLAELGGYRGADRGFWRLLRLGGPKLLREAYL